MEMCRACMNVGCELLCIDAVFLDNYNLLTSLSVKLGDGLPQSFCQQCSDAVNFFITFRNKCNTSESSLCETLKKSVSIMFCKNENVKVEKNDEIDIKEEITYESITYDEYIIDETLLDEDEQKLSLLKLLKSENDFKPRKSTRITNKISKIDDDLKKTDKIIIPTKPRISKVNAKSKPLNFDCGLCSNSYEDKKSLNEHLEKHKKGTQCSICEESFSSWPHLLSHRINHLQPTQRHCHICNKKCMVDIYLEYHYLKLHHDEKFTGVPCHSCGHVAETARRLSKHIWYKHSGRSLPCPECTKVFQNKSNLRNHMKLHSDVKQYTCETCGFACKHSGGMIDHKLRKHSAEKFNCKICSRVFKSEEAMSSHKCSAQRLCTVCGGTFKSSGALKRHMRCHSEERPFACPRCPARYKSAPALRAHVDKHRGHRAERCDVCPAEFHYRSALIKHRRRHTGEKPYVCKICKKGFTGNNNLKVHMKVHGQMLIVKKNKDEVKDAISTPC